MNVGEDDMPVWDAAYAWWMVEAGGGDGVAKVVVAGILVFPGEGNV